MTHQRQPGTATLIHLSSGQVALQAGYLGFIAALPLALARSGASDALIGLVVGIVAVVQIPAALIAGPLLDRFGPVRLLIAGAGAYLLSVLVLLAARFDPADTIVPFVIARIAQGIGFGLTRPAWLSLLPRLLSSRRSGMGLGVALSVQNLSMIVMPALSLVVLGSSASLDGVALVVGSLVLLGVISLLTASRDFELRQEDWAQQRALRRYGFVYRWKWTPPLAIMLFYLIHWGSLTAYLPQQAELAGANVGLFFVADGFSSLAIRIPAGWLSDRVTSRWLVLCGLLLTAGAIGLLVLPLATPTLILAGALTGSGAGLVSVPIYVELAELSSVGERGSAYALVSVVASIGNVMGSIGLAPVIDGAGFEAAILVSTAGFVIATAIAVADRQLGAMGGSLPATAYLPQRADAAVGRPVSEVPEVRSSTPLRKAARRKWPNRLR